jgi:hypothetical protein
MLNPEQIEVFKMSLPFINRNPTELEVEHFRLILSSYELISDLVHADQKGEPRSLDFKHIVATLFHGTTQTRFFSSFDVIIKNDEIACGIKCKILRLENLDELKDGQICFAHRFSGKSPKTLSFFAELGIDNENFQDKPKETGLAITKCIEDEYKIKGHEIHIDTNRSLYLILIHDTRKQYQLIQIPYKFPDPAYLEWSFDDHGETPGLIVRPLSHKTLIGRDSTGIRLTCDLYTKTNKSGVKTYKIETAGTIKYYPSLKDIIWTSKILQIENHPLTLEELFERVERRVYSVSDRFKILKRIAIERLEQLIKEDALEKDFQKLLEDNPWIFGSEYSELLKRRIWVRDQQQDFMCKRTTDGFLEVIEIKRPLNDRNLFSWDDSHKTFYPGNELSKSIGQVINYLATLDSDRDRIRSNDGEDTNKIRVKLVIGRDRDERQVESLRNLNSHINRIEIVTFDQLLKIAKRVSEIF